MLDADVQQACRLVAAFTCSQARVACAVGFQCPPRIKNDFADIVCGILGRRMSSMQGTEEHHDSHMTNLVVTQTTIGGSHLLVVYNGALGPIIQSSNSNHSFQP